MEIMYGQLFSQIHWMERDIVFKKELDKDHSLEKYFVSIICRNYADSMNAKVLAALSTVK